MAVVDGRFFQPCRSTDACETGATLATELGAQKAIQPAPNAAGYWLPTSRRSFASWVSGGSWKLNVPVKRPAASIRNTVAV